MNRIGIRREEKNEWERRVPLTPDHVAELVGNHALELSIQPAARRAFPDKDYLTAGARIDEGLTDCRVVLGVKEIPTDDLEPDRAYLYFSHTTKAQAYNMPMLARLLELGSTLIDYEQMLDDRGRRVVFFGRYAGHAGMIDALWVLGRRLQAEGHVTPFERVRLAHDYSSLDEATHHVHRVGERLRHSGLSVELHPMIVGFTGSGNVTRGAQEIFDRLPHVEIDAEEIESLVADTSRPRNMLYRVNFRREQRFDRTDGGGFDADEFAGHPDRYSNGLRRWLPHLTALIHGAYWKPAHPRVVALGDLHEVWHDTRRRLRLIADVSCDIHGGIEATVAAGTPGDPVYVYDLRRDEPIPGVHGDGPVILAVDNLPCQLPVEASEHFADTLVRFVPALAECDWNRPLESLELPSIIKRAVIAHRGRLTPEFAYLERELRQARTP